MNSAEEIARLRKHTNGKWKIDVIEQVHTGSGVEASSGYKTVDGEFDSKEEAQRFVLRKMKIKLRD